MDSLIWLSICPGGVGNLLHIIMEKTHSGNQDFHGQLSEIAATVLWILNSSALFTGANHCMITIAKYITIYNLTWCFG